MQKDMRYYINLIESANITEAPIYSPDTYFVSKEDLLKVIDNNYDIDHNKLMQLTGDKKPIIKVIKPIEKEIEPISGFKRYFSNRPLMLPVPVKKVLEPGIHPLNQDSNGNVTLYDMRFFDKSGNSIDVLGDLFKLENSKSKFAYKALKVYNDYLKDNPDEFDAILEIHLKDLLAYIQ